MKCSLGGGALGPKAQGSSQGFGNRRVPQRYWVPERDNENVSLLKNFCAQLLSWDFIPHISDVENMPKDDPQWNRLGEKGPRFHS